MQKQKKYFIITIDTEGDNLWEWQEGTPITTENAKYLPRFQELCDKYNFKPTWLCNWEMMNDPELAAFIKDNLKKQRCEVGMHLHAWNTPPQYELPGDKTSGKAYLIEYPENIMREKIEQMTRLIEEKVGERPTVHRAGRWAMNDIYFRLLKEQGYIADCSVTPSVNWEKSVGQTPGFKGPNYRHEGGEISEREGIVEIPVSTMWSHKMFIRAHFTRKGIKKEIEHRKTGRTLWLRPTGRNLHEMLYLIRKKRRSLSGNYLMFMLHSSELMPGGSPNFRTPESLEKLYGHMEIIFREIAKDYQGIGLGEYVQIIKNNG